MEIAQLLADFAGYEVGLRKILEIETSIKSLSEQPHIGTIRKEIAEGLRAIPAARKGVITFTIDDDLRRVYILSVTYAGADWIARSKQRTNP